MNSGGGPHHSNPSPEFLPGGDATNGSNNYSHNDLIDALQDKIIKFDKADAVMIALGFRPRVGHYDERIRLQIQVQQHRVWDDAQLEERLGSDAEDLSKPWLEA